MPRKRLFLLACATIFALGLIAVPSPAQAWDSGVAFSGTFVGPHGSVVFSSGPYYNSGYGYYRPYRRYAAYPYRYYRPYVRTYAYRPYYVRPYVRRFYVRPAPVYYGYRTYCPY